MSKRPPREVAREVLTIESQAIRDVIPQLDESFDRAVELIADSSGRVVCTGMGKSGLILQKVAATLASTGTPAFFLHPAEAIHGDLGMVVEKDIVLAASNSGATEELLRLAEILKRLGVPLIAITGNPRGSLATLADLHLSVEITQEACPHNLAPTASTTAALALGDALAMAVMESRGFSADDFALLHPGGRLGKRLLKVSELMHTGDALPAVTTTTSMRDVIYEMSRKGLGVTAITENDWRLAGVISDGDLRRLLEAHGNVLGRTAGECMHLQPMTIDGDELASVALSEMEKNRITSLFVCDSEGKLQGIVHLHDLWRLELF